MILCLRGGDPFLPQCIDGLLCQDYPGYRVRFVIDSQEDPARSVVEATLSRHRFEQYKIVTLTSPLATCSLKCSSLAQVLQEIMDEEQRDGDNGANGNKSRAAGSFVALLDADTIPHRSWLRELATGLRPTEVGARDGHRWYMPDRPSLGSMTRHIWNAAAIVQMYFYQICWGGTLAIKLDSFRRADLLAWWTKALCEDTMTQSRLATIGQHVAFVPSLMMVNRENVSLARLTPWIRRQLLTTRLYHPFWSLVLFHGISSAAQLLWGWGMCIWFLTQGQWNLAIACAAVLVFYQIALNSLLPVIASAVEKIVRARGEETDWRRNLSWLGMTQAILVTQWVYTWALISCLFTRQVNWRGIDYRVDGPGRYAC